MAPRKPHPAERPSRPEVLALHNAIRADPEDHAARLALADLIEAGEVREDAGVPPSTVGSEAKDEQPRREDEPSAAFRREGAIQVAEAQEHRAFRPAPDQSPHPSAQDTPTDFRGWWLTGAPLVGMSEKCHILRCERASGPEVRRDRTRGSRPNREDAVGGRRVGPLAQAAPAARLGVCQGFRHARRAAGEVHPGRRTEGYPCSGQATPNWSSTPAAPPEPREPLANARRT